MDKKAVLIRIDKKLAELLKKEADEQKRSLSAHIEYLLEHLKKPQKFS